VTRQTRCKNKKKQHQQQQYHVRGQLKTQQACSAPIIFKSVQQVNKDDLPNWFKGITQL